MGQLPEGERPQRLLVVVAHPGDAELEIGGSVARWVAEGTVAWLACCTSGDAGGDDPRADPLELAADREREQRAAAALIGYEAVTFLHQPEGALANDLALREQLARLVRAFRPDVVASPDPRVLFFPGGGVNHVDHRQAGEAAVDTIATVAGRAMAFPHLARSEDLEPHRVGRLLLFASDQPTTAVDINDTFELKLQALSAHRGRQVQRDVERATEAARRDGERAGLARAESFLLVELE